MQHRTRGECPLLRVRVVRHYGCCVGNPARPDTSTVAGDGGVTPIMASRTAILASGSHDQPPAADGDRCECGRQPEQEPDEARDEGELAEVSSVA